METEDTEDSTDIILTEPPGTLARLAQIAKQRPITLEHTDVAERSREILDTEYVEYLRKRMDRPAVNDGGEPID